MEIPQIGNATVVEQQNGTPLYEQKPLVLIGGQVGERPVLIAWSK